MAWTSRADLRQARHQRSRDDALLSDRRTGDVAVPRPAGFSTCSAAGKANASSSATASTRRRARSSTSWCSSSRSRRRTAAPKQYLLRRELPSEIVACAKVQTVEFHGWGSRAGAVETPDRLVIDLDPDPKLGFDDCEGCSVPAAPVVRGARARELRVASRRQGHPRRRSARAEIAEWDPVREFAKTLLHALGRSRAGRGSPSPCRRRSVAGGSSSISCATSARRLPIMPYSARARAGMPVAAPVAWEELEEIDRSDAFTIADVEQLLERASGEELRKLGRRPTSGFLGSGDRLRPLAAPFPRR